MEQGLETEKPKSRHKCFFFFFFTFPKRNHIARGEIRECKHKQPRKEAKKSEAKRSKRNTVTKLSGFVTIAPPPANEW